MRVNYILTFQKLLFFIRVSLNRRSRETAVCDPLILGIPLAGKLLEVVVTDCAKVGDSVVAAVYVGQSLAERQVKSRKLVVVAKNTLKEGLVAKIQVRKVVVRAVYELNVRTILYREGGQVIVGANHIKKSVAVAKCQSLHVVV